MKLKTIRLAFVCTSLNQIGGKNRHLSNLYKYLDSDKFKVIIILCSSVEEKQKDFMLKEGVLKEDLLFLSRRKKRLLIPFILDLRKILLARNINVIHTLDIQSDIFGSLAARSAGIENIFALFESKVIPENTPFIKSFLYKFFNKMIKSLFKKTVVVSEGLQNEVVSEGLRDSDRTSVIHLGFNIPGKYRNRKWLFEGLMSGKPLIGTISRLSTEKGLDRLVNIIPLVSKNFPDAKFIIIGEGPEKDRLGRLAQELGVSSKLIIKEWADDVFPELEKIDIFVMPSLREGCPNALFEAMALSRPVVVSDIEGLRDIVEDERNGVLVDTVDLGKFAEKIQYFCKDPERAIVLGESGRSTILEKFSIESEMDAYERLYLEAPID